jgi:hypothetical protein
MLTFIILVLLILVVLVIILAVRCSRQKKHIKTAYEGIGKKVKENELLRNQLMPFEQFENEVFCLSRYRPNDKRKTSAVFAMQRDIAKYIEFEGDTCYLFVLLRKSKVNPKTGGGVPKNNPVLIANIDTYESEVR